MRSKKIRRKRKEKTKKYKGGNKTKAYVINLDKRTDRWEQIQDKFKGSSFELERVSAVEDPNAYLGCSLSFQKVIQIRRRGEQKKNLTAGGLDLLPFFLLIITIYRIYLIEIPRMLPAIRDGYSSQRGHTVRSAH